MEERPPTMGLDLKQIDERILDELHDGRNVPSNLAETLDVSRQYVQQRLALLEAADHVENIGRGVYELLDDPREETESPRDSPDEERYRKQRDNLVELVEMQKVEIQRLRDQCIARNDMGEVVHYLDTALRELHSTNPDVDSVETALNRASESIADLLVETLSE
jgi:ArsR family transcriptional regulator, cadmium/lead-responsive transcriptional repressor